MAIESCNIHNMNITAQKPNVPYYKSEKCFQRYALIIGKAVTEYPAAFQYIPEEAVETFRSRFCYAIKAKKEFAYQHPAIDNARFDLIGQEITCLMRVGCVYIGPISACKQLIGKNLNVKAFLPTNVPLLQKPEIEFTGDINELIIMLNKKCFLPQPVFIVTSTEETITKLSEQNDIAVVLIEHGKWKIL